MKLVAGSTSVLLQDALYWDDFIDHGTMAENGGYSSMRILAMRPEKIEVLDHRDELIASFSSRGFQAMLDRAIRCSK